MLQLYAIPWFLTMYTRKYPNYQNCCEISVFTRCFRRSSDGQNCSAVGHSLIGQFFTSTLHWHRNTDAVERFAVVIWIQRVHPFVL